LGIHRLAYYSILLSYLLIAFGGFVASSGSGMGCGPEWPLCNGAVIPELSGETLIEFTHRLIGFILALLVGALFFKIKRSQTATTLDRKVANWMISLFALQVILGAIIVLLDLPIWIIIFHLYIAMAFLTTLLWIWRSTSPQLNLDQTSSDKNNRKSIVKHMNICLILLLITLGFGGYIKHQHSHGEGHGHSTQQLEDGQHGQGDQHAHGGNHAKNNYHGISESEATPVVDTFDWLFQWDSWIPLPNNWKQVIEATHLTLAVISSIYILFLSYCSISKEWESGINIRLIIAAATVLSQVTVGIVMVYIDIPLFWAVLHLAFGTFLLITVIETRLYLSQTGSSRGYGLQKNAI
jgi:heme a synthase